MRHDREEDGIVRERALWILSGIDLNGLNEWEKNFIESIQERIEDDLCLTEGQMDKLEQIYKERGRWE